MQLEASGEFRLGVYGRCTVRTLFEPQFAIVAQPSVPMANDFTVCGTLNEDSSPYTSLSSPIP